MINWLKKTFIKSGGEYFIGYQPKEDCESLPATNGSSKMPKVKEVKLTKRDSSLVNRDGFVSDDRINWFRANIVYIKDNEAVCDEVEIFPPYLTAKFKYWKFGTDKRVLIDYNFMRLHKDGTN